MFIQYFYTDLINTLYICDGIQCMTNWLFPFIFSAVWSISWMSWLYFFAFHFSQRTCFADKLSTKKWMSLFLYSCVDCNHSSAFAIAYNSAYVIELVPVGILSLTRSSLFAYIIIPAPEDFSPVGFSLKRSFAAPHNKLFHTTTSDVQKTRIEQNLDWIFVNSCSE